MIELSKQEKQLKDQLCPKIPELDKLYLSDDIILKYEELFFFSKLYTFIYVLVLYHLYGKQRSLYWKDF
jgi:hypothetical protein